MNKEQLIARYKEVVAHERKRFGDRFVLCAGGTMVLYGLRETTNDLDLGVAADRFDYYAGLFGCDKYLLSKPYYGADWLRILAWDEGVDLHPTVPSAEMVNYEGILTYTLKETLNLYRAMGRVKDRESILILEDHLKLKPRD